MMRIAILSDIHGNRTAFEAVLADLQQTSPDLILHGGDLADAGANPVEIVDRIRDLGWPGIVGNTDELIFRPESLEEFANQSSAPASLWTAIREMAATIRSMLGEERIGWLRGLSRVHIQDPMALVHASPESLWRAPAPEATDAVLESIYGSLRRPIVVYGHIHRPYIRSFPSPPFPEGLIANTGSVGLPYDGDRRASYLLFDESSPTIRRVEYSVEREIKALSSCGLPHADWIAKTLRAASPQLP
jgi:predicted phosphodiesterase